MPAARLSFCPSGGGCGAVLASKYSTFLGIPLPWMGVASYLALLGLLLLALGGQNYPPAGRIARSRRSGWL
jgi:uncharacterized membrane protein